MDNILLRKLKEVINLYYAVEESEEESEEEYEPESESESEEESEIGLVNETLKVNVDEKGLMSLDLEY